ncbi:hypothetical protein ACFSUS_07760 [Spirosoma soli]|uniref:Uncharacterized protein n=1 Tax=Spirosoma soli TaxID=1770529 RepID=A0ABW5M2L1_9BACT
MNSANFGQTTNTGFLVSGFPSWQVEVGNLRRNYTLLESMLGQSSMLSAEVAANYRSVQQLLTKTLEQFLIELDKADSRNALGRPTTDALLMKHASTMRQVNKFVSKLLREQQVTVN